MAPFQEPDGKGFRKVRVLGTINTIMEKQKKPGQHYAAKSPSRGGARAGAGRPRGSTNKITMDNLLASLDTRLGQSYAEQIASN